MQERTLDHSGLWKLAFALVVLGALFFSYSVADATMFACRTSRGGVEYTNVRSSAQCKPVSLRNNSTRNSVAAFSSGTRSFRGSGKGSSGRYDSHIRMIASRYGVDASLIKAIIHIESGFNHRAVSNKGAQGLMQLMPGTAKDLRVWNPFDPLQNIDGGTRYFRKILDDFNGNLRLSLAAYNAGPGLVGRIGRIPAIPETRKYVQKVLSQYQYYKLQSQ